MRLESQKGVTLIGALIIAFFVGSFGWTAIIMIGIHMEHLKVQGALDGLKTVSFVTKKDDNDIRKLLYNQLDADRVTTERLRYYQKLFQISKDNGVLKVTIKYTVTRTYVGTFTLPGTYSDTVKIPFN